MLTIPNSVSARSQPCCYMWVTLRHQQSCSPHPSRRSTPGAQHTCAVQLTEKWAALRHLRSPDFFADEYLDAFAHDDGAEVEHGRLRVRRRGPGGAHQPVL